jgi:hypothetical protein
VPDQVARGLSLHPGSGGGGGVGELCSLSVHFQLSKFVSRTSTWYLHLLSHMKNRLTLAIAIALTVAIISFLNLSLGGGAYYYNRLTDEFEEVILDRSQMRILRRNARPHPDDNTEIINNNGNHRSLQQTSPYFDPKTVTAKESTPFIIPEANLADTKHAEPTVIRSNPTYVTHITYGDSCPTKIDGNCNGSCDCRWSWPTYSESRAPWKSSQAKCRCIRHLPAHNGMVVDVLSIGSKSQPEFVSSLCYASICCKAYSSNAS